MTHQLPSGLWVFGKAERKEEPKAYPRLSHYEHFWWKQPHHRIKLNDGGLLVVRNRRGGKHYFHIGQKDNSWIPDKLNAKRCLRGEEYEIYT